MAVKDRDAQAPASLASMRRPLTKIVPMLPPRWLLPWQTIRSAVLGGLVLGAAAVPATIQGAMASELTIGISMPQQVEPVVRALFDAEQHAAIGPINFDVQHSGSLNALRQVCQPLSGGEPRVVFTTRPMPLSMSKACKTMTTGALRPRRRSPQANSPRADSPRNKSPRATEISAGSPGCSRPALP